jgi:hypothetical protein
MAICEALDLPAQICIKIMVTEKNGFTDIFISYVTAHIYSGLVPPIFLVIYKNCLFL